LAEEIQGIQGYIWIIIVAAQDNRPQKSVAIYCVIKIDVGQCLHSPAFWCCWGSICVWPPDPRSSSHPQCLHRTCGCPWNHAATRGLL